MSVEQSQHEWKEASVVVNKWRERMTGPRRFPPPWIIEEANNACFIVKDHNGQALSYVYLESEPARKPIATACLKSLP
jgi:hypothetical protein